MAPPDYALFIYNEQGTCRFPDFLLERAILSGYVSFWFEVCKYGKVEFAVLGEREM